jgi:hypothetical protein
MIHSSIFVSGIHKYFGSALAVHLKCHLIFKAFFRNGFVSLDALVTLLADLGLVGNVGSVLVGVDLGHLGKFDRLCHARKMGNQMLIRF